LKLAYFFQIFILFLITDSDTNTINDFVQKIFIWSSITKTIFNCDLNRIESKKLKYIKASLEFHFLSNRLFFNFNRMIKVHTRLFVWFCKSFSSFSLNLNDFNFDRFKMNKSSIFVRISNQNQIFAFENCYSSGVMCE
jgi:hypothetical protein